MGLAAFQRMRKMKAQREAREAEEAKALAELEAALEAEQKLIDEAEKLGVDPDLYMMTDDQLETYCFEKYGFNLDKRKKHLTLVKQVMELEAQADEDEESNE